MSENPQPPDFVMHPGEKTTLLFTQMILQMSSLASLLLGKVPHPETGKTMRDLQGAQLVIDQLDMLQTKTKGNLSPEEDKLLRQTLMGLRLEYVDAVNRPAPEEEAKTEEDAPATEPAASAAGDAAEPASPESADTKKKFTKKY